MPTPKGEPRASAVPSMSRCTARLGLPVVPASASRNVSPSTLRHTPSAKNTNDSSTLNLPAASALSSESAARGRSAFEALETT